MGIIERQSKNNLFILGFAVLFGALNNIILFPAALSKEEWGVIRFLPTVAIIVSNIALIGSPQILLRYMPAFVKKNQTNNNGLFNYILKLTFFGILFIILLLWILKPSILGLYEENASRLANYYVYLFPLFILNTLTELLSAYARAYFLSVFQMFLREIVHRVVQAILLILVIIHWIDFEIFIVLFTFSLSINVILMILFLNKKKVLDSKPSTLPNKEKRKIFKYGGANLLTGLGATITGRIDSLMVTALVSVGVVATGNGGLEAVAIYAFGAYLISVVEMPARAVSSIANSIVAKAWENNDLNELETVYKKTSINQLIVGCLIFILIWAGIDELFEIIGKYEEAKWVVFFLGIGKIINISTGALSSIIMSSRFYLFAMYSMLFLAVVTYFLNLYFIPIYGVNGAAIATLISLFIYYFLSLLKLKIKTGLQPYSFKTVLLLIVSVCLFLLANTIDFELNPILEILVMTSIISPVYLILIYSLRISEEMNQTMRNIISKGSKLFARKIIFPLVFGLKLEKKLNKAKKNAVLNVMYHGVVSSSKNTIIRNITADKFEQHLQYFIENFEIVSLDEAMNRIYSKDRKSTKQTITLSFDDGYLNNLTVLLPILEKYNVPATVYVLGHVANKKYENIKTVWSNYIDFLYQSNEIDELHRLLKCKNEERQDLNVYYDLVKKSSSEEMKELLIQFSKSSIVKEKMKSFDEESYLLMNSEQLEQLSKSSLITIGSHAYWHCNLAEQSVEVQKKEMTNSKKELELIIREKVHSFSFPDGSYTRFSLDIAKEVGYLDLWAVNYKFDEDRGDGRILDRFGMPTQTTFKSNMIFLNLAFNKKSHP